MKPGKPARADVNRCGPGRRACIAGTRKQFESSALKTGIVEFEDRTDWQTMRRDCRRVPDLRSHKCPDQELWLAAIGHALVTHLLDRCRDLTIAVAVGDFWRRAARHGSASQTNSHGSRAPDRVMSALRRAGMTRSLMRKRRRALATWALVTREQPLSRRIGAEGARQTPLQPVNIGTLRQLLRDPIGSWLWWALRR